MRVLDQFLPVFKCAEDVRVLHHYAGGRVIEGGFQRIDIAAGAVVRRFDDDQFDVQVLAVAADHFTVDWRHRPGQHGFASAVEAHRHHDRLEQCGTAVIQ